MKYFSKSAFGLLVFAVMLLVTRPVSLPGLFISDAEARIGRPLTPVSYAGVARRTTRRSVYGATAVTAAATTAAVVSQPVIVAEQQPVTVVEQPVTVVKQQAPLPIGSTLTSLPSGCQSETVNNASYFSCGGNWFKPVMQGGNVVYSVIADPN